VEVEEEPLHNVAVLPASALSTDGRIFLVTKDNRLKEFKGELVRRQGQNWVVSDLPFGETYVKARSPYLSENIKVQPRREVQSHIPQAMTILNEDRRLKLIALVKKNKGIPDAAKTRIVKRLSQPQVPVSLVERFERRLAKAEPPESSSMRIQVKSRPVEGPTDPVADARFVALSAEDRKRLKSFVESRRRMPDQEKSRILSQLNQPKVPKEMIDQLEARIKRQSR
jgi:hypothetical protein